MNAPSRTRLIGTLLLNAVSTNLAVMVMVLWIGQLFGDPHVGLTFSAPLALAILVPIAAYSQVRTRQLLWDVRVTSGALTWRQRLEQLPPWVREVGRYVRIVVWALAILAAFGAVLYGAGWALDSVRAH